MQQRRVAPEGQENGRRRLPAHPGRSCALPYRLNIVLTDNGIQFNNHDRHIYAFEHIFDWVYHQHQIEHRLTKIKHPWTNGQVERMNRTIKDATVKRFHYDDHDQLRAHLANFISA